MNFRDEKDLKAPYSYLFIMRMVFKLHNAQVQSPIRAVNKVSNHEKTILKSYYLNRWVLGPVH